MDVQLRHLRALVAVVDTGTFTDAAVELGVSQASVSRSVASLEASLGADLLHRTTRAVSLTPVGTQVVAAARRVLEDVRHLCQVVADSGAELRVGYAWAALGKHTRQLQRSWAAAHPDVPLVFVQSNTPSAGLSEGIADVAVVRRPLDDPRFDGARVGQESRYAALASDNALARRRTVRLRDVLRYPLAVDTRTGTTTPDLWSSDAPPPAVRTTGGVDEWLTLIAAGQAVGITSEATANQNPRPGVAYRALSDAPPIAVWLVWWKDDRVPLRTELLELITRTYADAYAARHRRRSSRGPGSAAGAGPPHIDPLRPAD